MVCGAWSEQKEVGSLVFSPRPQLVIFFGFIFWVTGPNPAWAHQPLCPAHVSVQECWKSESRSPELLINAPPLIGTSFRCWTSTSSFEIRK